MGEGFFMHDIVRDFAISRCGDLRALQRRFLEAVVAAQPAPGGWPLRDGLSRGSAEWYVAVHASFHVSGAIGDTARALPAVDVQLLERLIDDSSCLGEACGAVRRRAGCRWMPPGGCAWHRACAHPPRLACRPAPWRSGTPRCCAWPRPRSGGAR